jgi:hypothetical protein
LLQRNTIFGIPLQFIRTDKADGAVNDLYAKLMVSILELKMIVTHPGTEELVFSPLLLQIVFDIVYNFIESNEPFTVRNVFLSVWTNHISIK